MKRQSFSAPDPDTVPEEIKTRFGEYLTNQYELLERTLSVLDITDLLNASRVCKSWHQTASYILRAREKNSKFRWHLQCRPPCNATNCFRNNIKFTSQFLLGFKVPKDDMSVVRQLFESRNTELRVPGLFGETYIIDSDTLEVSGYTSDNNLEYFSNRSAALFFPKTDRYVVQTNFSRPGEMKLCAVIQRCMLTEKYGNLKGILVFAKKVDFQLIHVLYNRVLETFQQQPIALAGGIFSNVKEFNNKMWVSKDGVLTLFFFGDVDCYSDILTESRKSEIAQFMKNMRQNIGDIDTKKYQRIAFVIRCLGRSHGKYENMMFRKYFPETATFVLVSHGECGYRADSSKSLNVPKRSRTEVSITYAYSTIYFFVTVKLQSAYKK